MYGSGRARRIWHQPDALAEDAGGSGSRQGPSGYTPQTRGFAVHQFRHQTCATGKLQATKEFLYTEELAAPWTILLSFINHPLSTKHILTLLRVCLPVPGTQGARAATVQPAMPVTKLE